MASDPRTSPRPAEAIRIAAGISVWKEVPVVVYLCGPGVLALDAAAFNLIDQLNFRDYLPLLGEGPEAICVEKDCGCIGEIAEPLAAFHPISSQELARIAAKSHAVLRF